MHDDDPVLSAWKWEPLEEGDQPFTSLIEDAKTHTTDLSKTVAKLWEPELLRQLQTQTPAWPREPAKPLTLRQRVRLFWWHLLDKWPLQWKRDDDEGDWD